MSIAPGRGTKKKHAKGINPMLTTEVPVVLLATLSVTVLGLSSPVGHAAQLVALREGSVGHAVEHVVTSGDRTPRVLSRKGGHQISD